MSSCSLKKKFYQNKRQGKGVLIDCYFCLHSFCMHVHYMYIVINSSYSPELLNSIVGTLFGTVTHYISETKNVVHEVSSHGWSLSLVHCDGPCNKYHEVGVTAGEL